MITLDVLTNKGSTELTRDKFTVDEARTRIESIFDEYSIKVTPVDMPLRAKYDFDFFQEKKSISRLGKSTIGKSHAGFEIQEITKDGQRILIYFRTKVAKGYGLEGSIVTPSQVREYESALEKELAAFQTRERTAQEVYAQEVKNVEKLREEASNIRIRLSDLLIQICGTADPKITGIKQEPVSSLFPSPVYKSPEMPKVPYHEGPLVDENGDLSTATIESALIISMTHDLTLPRYQHVESVYPSGVATGDSGYYSNDKLTVDKRSYSAKKVIEFIKNSRGIQTSADFNSNGYVYTFNTPGRFEAPEPSYFYGVAESRAEFGSLLRRVFEAGKEVSGLVNNLDSAKKRI